jgi:hypothetical protein
VRGHCQDVGLRLVHVDSSRLSFATGAWAAEPWCCSEDERASPAVLERLELPVLGDRGLVHVSRGDKLGARFDERLKDGVPSSQWAFVRCAPGRRGEVVMKGDDPERPFRCSRQL